MSPAMKISSVSKKLQDQKGYRGDAVLVLLRRLSQHLVRMQKDRVKTVRPPRVRFLRLRSSPWIPSHDKSNDTPATWRFPMPPLDATQRLQPHHRPQTCKLPTVARDSKRGPGEAQMLRPYRQLFDLVFQFADEQTAFFQQLGQMPRQSGEESWPHPPQSQTHLQTKTHLPDPPWLGQFQRDVGSAVKTNSTTRCRCLATVYPPPQK